MGMPSSSEGDAQGDLRGGACGDELVMNGGDGGLRIARVFVDVDGSDDHARLPLLQRAGDAVLDLEARGDGVRLEEVAPQTAAETRQVQTLALLGAQNDLDVLADVRLAFAPGDAPVGADVRREGHAASVESSGVHVSLRSPRSHRAWRRTSATGDRSGRRAAKRRRCRGA